MRNNLGGKGATARTMIRLIIPTVLVLVPLWLTPTTLYVHASMTMTLPIFLPYVVFSHVLNKVWRRHRLRERGLDPYLVDEHVRSRNAHIRRAYIERYGPRPVTTFQRPDAEERGSLVAMIATPLDGTGVGTSRGPHVTRDGERSARLCTSCRAANYRLAPLTCGNALPLFTGVTGSNPVSPTREDWL